MNILLQEEKPSGGAAVQAYGWIRGLSAIGQEVHVITNTTHKESVKEDCKDIKLVPLYDRKKGVRWLRWAYYRFPYIYRKVKQVKPDYLYQGIPGWTSFLLALICRQLNIKYVLRISSDVVLDDNFYYKNPSKVQMLFQRAGLRLSYCILCQNEHQLSIIKKAFPNKLAVKITNPIIIESAQNATIQERQYIAWLGTFRYPKNLKLLYEIASTLRHEQFIVAGAETTKVDEETGLYLPKLRELPNVKFIGFLSRQDVLPYLAKAKFLLNTSRYEGFSNTFLEAMSVGTPILSSDNVNPDGILTNHKLGIVYSSPEGLLTQYATITPATYQAMSENASAYVLEHHNYKALAKSLLLFLNSN